MVTIKKVNEQLEKKNNVNKVWIKENGDLVIHTSGAARIMASVANDFYNK